VELAKGGGLAKPVAMKGEAGAPEAAAAATPAAEGATKAPAVATFKTAKGSTYEVHEDGTTTRNKAARADLGHEGDSGPKQRSAKTVYVEDARAFSPPDSAKWRVVRSRRWTMSLAVQNADGKWGISPESRNSRSRPSREWGLSPLELWKPDTVYGRPAYRGVHPGNKITEISGPAGAEKVGERQEAAAAEAKPAAPEPQKPAEKAKPASALPPETQAAIDRLPEVKEGYTRLYRGEYGGPPVKLSDWLEQAREPAAPALRRSRRKAAGGPTSPSWLNGIAARPACTAASCGRTCRRRSRAPIG
jgi:hypothetical protein